MENSRWYAIMDGSIEDNDWGTGSFDEKEAIKRCRKFNDYRMAEDGSRPWYIAIIENDTCVGELKEEDF